MKLKVHVHVQTCAMFVPSVNVSVFYACVSLFYQHLLMSINFVNEMPSTMKTVYLLPLEDDIIVYICVCACVCVCNPARRVKKRRCACDAKEYSGECQLVT